MSDNKDNISQIDRYLKGELDARAMHKLEREAQDDPFLMDALEGYAASGKDPDRQVNLDELKARLAARVAPKKERNIILWRVLPLAASLLLMLGIGGYWFFSPKPMVKQYAAIEKLQNTIEPPVKIKEEPQLPAPVKENIVAHDSKRSILKQAVIPPVYKQPGQLASGMPAQPNNGISYKEDTVQYNASAYKTKPNSKVDEWLKHMEGMDVAADGSVTHQGLAVTKVRINGKDFIGGSVQSATKNLPAAIVNSIQVIDDYGDQAAKTGVKTGDPAKILNITTDTFRKLIAANNVLRQNGLNNDSEPKSLNEVRVTGYGTLKKKELTGSMTTINKNTDTVTIINGLSGRVAGLVIASDKKAAVPILIKGRVAAKADGLPLPGASISVNGQPAGQTGADGTFKISVPPDGATISAAFVGYEPLQVKINKPGDVKIALSANAGSLSEVVVTGYGTKIKQNNTSPQPVNGWKMYNQYLQENSRITNGKKVVVKLSFTVAGNGNLSNIKILKGGPADLNQRAINLITNGPKWIGAAGKEKEVRLKVKFHQ